MFFIPIADVNCWITLHLDHIFEGPCVYLAIVINSDLHTELARCPALRIFKIAFEFIAVAVGKPRGFE